MKVDEWIQAAARLFAPAHDATWINTSDVALVLLCLNIDDTDGAIGRALGVGRQREVSIEAVVRVLYPFLPEENSAAERLECFQFFDDDSKGAVSKHDLVRAVGGLLTGGECGRLVEKLGTSKGITYAEWCKLLPESSDALLLQRRQEREKRQAELTARAESDRAARLAKADAERRRQQEAEAAIEAERLRVEAFEAAAVAAAAEAERQRLRALDAEEEEEELAMAASVRSSSAVGSARVGPGGRSQSRSSHPGIGLRGSAPSSPTGAAAGRKSTHLAPPVVMAARKAPGGKPSKLTSSHLRVPGTSAGTSLSADGRSQSESHSSVPSPTAAANRGKMPPSPSARPTDAAATARQRANSRSRSDHIGSVGEDDALARSHGSAPGGSPRPRAGSVAKGVAAPTLARSGLSFSSTSHGDEVDALARSHGSVGSQRPRGGSVAKTAPPVSAAKPGARGAAPRAAAAARSSASAAAQSQARRPAAAPTTTIRLEASLRSAPQESDDESIEEPFTGTTASLLSSSGRGTRPLPKAVVRR
jgi:Ca2+-binding EF-hand superfamily protein